MYTLARLTASRLTCVVGGGVDHTTMAVVAAVAGDDRCTNNVHGSRARFPGVTPYDADESITTITIILIIP